MTGGESVSFNYKGKEVIFSFNEGKGEQTGLKKQKELMKNLLDAIKNSDGNKDISQEEFQMIKDLRSIFDAQGNGVSHAVDDEDEKILKAWNELSKKDKNASVKDFIAEQLEKINKKKEEEEEKAKANQTPSAEEQILIEQQKQEEARRLAEAEAEKQRIAQQAEQERIKAEQEAQQREITARNTQFNKAMQLKANNFRDTLNFTHEITIGENGLNNLFKIAKYALEQEGKTDITNKDLYDRIAQIVAANPQIKDVNKINKGDKIVIGTNGQTVRQEQEQEEVVVTEQGQAEVKTDLSGAIKTKDEPSVEGWTEVEDAPDVMTSEELGGGTVKTYTKTTGEGDAATTETKYVYEKDGIKLESNDPETLKTEAKKLNDALAEFGKAVDGETPDAKQARLQSALEVIKSIGTESAIKTQTHTTNLSTEYKAQQNMAILKSMNPALIEQMLGSDGGKFADAVKDSPETQMLIGSLISDLKAEYNNSTITLKKQKVLDILLECTDKNGVQIAEQNAVPAQPATEATPAVEAKDKVFAKTMKTDSEGVSMYYATLGGSNDTYKNMEFSASNPDNLNAFLVSLEKAVAETDETKRAEAIKAAVTEVLKSDDTALVKSVLKQGALTKDSAQEVINLINSTNSLDVLYSIERSEFKSETPTDGNPGIQDKENVQDAINARITAIMNDQTLSALPENQKYLAGVEEVDITGKEGVKITLYGEGAEVTKYIHTKADGSYELKDESSDESISVTQYADGRLKLNCENIGLDDNGTYIAAISVDELMKLSKELEALKVTTPSGEGTLTAEEKAENLDKMIKMLELCPTKEMYSDIARAIKSGLADKNDPKAKELVRELLLTRDAEVVRSIVLNAGNTDNTLFENDPKALKTVAAMLKEIRDKENAGERLSADEISLKNVLKEVVGKLEEKTQRLTFDHDGNLIVSLGDGVTGANSTVYDIYPFENTNLVVTDPILKKDKHALASIMNRDDLIMLSKDSVINLINLPAADAEILSKIDFSKLNSSLTADDKKAIQDAYIAKAKELFTYTSTEEGQKLDPASARYLNTILKTIDNFNAEVKKDGQKTDADDAVINKILGNLFKEVGEEGNKTLEINNFRRFTYEEMKGLASAVKNYGTDEQITALTNMITVEEMESGQFADAIEWSIEEYIVRDRLTKLVEAETDPQKVLAMIDNSSFSALVPFDTILTKDLFNTNEDILLKLLAKFNNYSELSKDSKTKLLDFAVANDGGVRDTGNTSSYYLLLQTEKDKERPEKETQLFNFLVVNFANNMYSLAKVYDKAVSDTERKQINDKIDAYITNNATDAARLMSVAEYFSKNSHAIEKLATVNFDNITGDDDKKTELREEFFEAAFGNNKSVPDKLVTNAVKNGWIEPVNITVGNTSYKYGLYRYKDGDTVYNRYLGNTETESILRKDSYKKLYGYVDGESKAADGVNIADVKDAGNITKDNVLGFIENGPKDKNGNVKIMRKLDRAWFGASATEMDRIPNALIEYAKEQGLDETNKALNELIAKMKQENRVSQGWTKGPENNDYILGYAKGLDKCIQEVVNELEKLKKANSDNNSN